MHCLFGQVVMENLVCEAGRLEMEVEGLLRDAFLCFVLNDKP
jgi:hypothetical protein